MLIKKRIKKRIITNIKEKHQNEILHYVHENLSFRTRIALEMRDREKWLILHNFLYDLKWK